MSKKKLTLYNFDMRDPDTNQYSSLGKYYIDITPKKLEKEVAKFITDENADWDFYSFIDYLSDKYEVEQYIEPDYVNIIY